MRGVALTCDYRLLVWMGVKGKKKEVVYGGRRNGGDFFVLH